MKRVLFLQWALFACLIAIGIVIGAMLGWGPYVLKDDPTHITLVTFAVFVVSTAWCGRLAWRLTSGEDPEEVEDSLASGWFASSVCVTIGLLGTVVGYFIMMKSASGGGDNAAEQLVRQIQLGMSTVLINTLVGGLAGLLIEVQSHFIGQAVKKAKQDAIHIRKLGDHE